MASSNTQLKGYQLGDCLGKGAFGQVYRALKWATGETVAVKEIQLSAIPKGEIGEIMSEIDLLKNLNHPNIVKYKGFVKTREFLYIILEFCENGSLHNICKRFGKFPENLVAVYISQVLEGLVYLHEQGVIHRDIKGANILTNKDGCVKLADFGVASKTTAGGVSDSAVVGSPYWMAPEVIEQSGATTASDIWSVGCVVIELLEGKPPYHFLDPMPALFRIVQDDCPPIPEGASPIVKDFLMHCFTKDVNFRISAKKLLRHPWMVAARKQMANDSAKKGEKENEGRKQPANYNYDEAVLKVQEWNEALKSPSKPIKLPKPSASSRQPLQDLRSASPTPGSQDIPSMLSPAIPASTSSGSQPTITLWNHNVAGSALKSAALQGGRAGALGIIEKSREPLPALLQEPEEQTDNWDDDFEEGISLSKLHGLDRTSIEDEKPDVDENAQTIRPSRSPSVPEKKLSMTKSPNPDISTIVEDYSDLALEEDDEVLQDKFADFKIRTSSRRGLFHPNDIKTVGLNTSPGAQTAPLPDVNRPSRPSLSPLTPVGTMARSHSRSSSYAGSMGRSDARFLQAPTEIDKYAEDDEEDYEDVFGKLNGTTVEHVAQTLQLNTRLSDKSWLGDEDLGEEDPFAEIEEDFAEEDMETNLQRDKHFRLCSLVNQLIDELTPSAPDFQVRDACNQLLEIMSEVPEMQGQLVSAHGMLAILEVLEAKAGSRDVVAKLLLIINVLVNADIGFLESFCLIGGIPVVMNFTSKKFSAECRLQASHFIRLLCQTSVLTLQMFIACRGLKVLVDLLDEDFVQQRDLVVHALNGIGNVFELQSPTPKNDFCRMFIKEGLLDPLTSALINVLAADPETSAEMKAKIIQILLVFCQVSQSDVHVRNALGTRMVVRRLLRACELLEPEYLVQMLKAVKHLSMNVTLLDVLQNANAIEILVQILSERSTGPHSTEMANHIFQTCYNLCRLNKSRQEEAAQAGIIPNLKRVIESGSPLKQFAQPILCDLASATKSCRNLLWQHDGLNMYLHLLTDPYFQVSALEAILSWLQDETARVEDMLIQDTSLEALLNCFANAKANSFENLLEPFLKICRLSKPVAIGISKSQFFQRLLDRLNHSKAVVRLALLRILKSICDVHPNKTALVDKFNIYATVELLSKDDGAVLVRELAREFLVTIEPALKPLPRVSKIGATPKTSLAPKKRTRRTASETSALDITTKPPTTPLSTRPTADVKPKPLRQTLKDIPWRSDQR